jgi:hypothetical protein
MVQLQEMNKDDFDPRSDKSMRGFLDEMKDKRINHYAEIVCVGQDVREQSR